jgi:MSHA biogenesis protein MshN
MSVINQMLRELDARGGAASDAPEGPIRAPVNARNSGKLVAAGLLLAVVAGVGYWVVTTGAPDQPMPQEPLISALPRLDVAPAPTVVATPVEHKVLPPVLPAPRVEAVQAPEKQIPSAIPLIQMATSLSVDPSQPPAKAEPAIQQVAILPVQAHAEPPADAKKSSVIKKMTELSPEAEAQQFYEDAQTLRRAGKREAAVGKCRQALARDPGMRPARLQLAGLLQDSGQVDEALQVLKTGYEQQPNDTLAIAAGRMLADQGQRDEALNWLMRGRAGLRPADFALMGALLSQLQRFDEAVKAYQRALASDPNQGGWLLGLGLALESLGRMEEARATYRKALERGEFKPDVIEFLQKKIG